MIIIRLRSFTLVALLAAGLLSTTNSKADVPSITNGSFENPVEATNSLTEITNTGVPGWTGDSIGGACHEYVINGNITDTYGRSIGNPEYGNQYLGLNAIANNSFTSIESQSVTGLTPGQPYTLTIYIANLDGAGDPNISLTVEYNSTGLGYPAASALFTAPTEGPYGQGTIDFVPETLTFTPTSNVIDINIGNKSRTGIMGIDNVSLAAVPEPSTVATALLGMGALAGVVFRRRKPQV